MPKPPQNNLPEPGQESLQQDSNSGSGGSNRIAGDVTALSSDGRGIVKAREQVFFAERVVPGDRVAFVPDLSSKNAVAREVKVLRKSPDRCQHPCAHAKTCPASEWGIVKYERQLLAKHELVCRVLRGVVDASLVAPMWASPNSWEYRNRLTLQVRPTARGGLEFGYALGARDGGLVPIRDCPLASSEVRGAVRELFAATRDLKGLRPEIIPSRLTVYPTESDVAVLFTYSGHKWEADVQEFLELTDSWTLAGQIWAGMATKAGLVESRGTFWREEERLSMRVGWLGHPLAIHPGGFSQANGGSTELVLQWLVAHRADFQAETVWDLYGGYGALGLAIAPDGGKLEVVEQSEFSEAAFARLASRRPEMTGSFHLGDVSRKLRKLSGQITGNDLVILDPPRSGCHPNVLAQLIESQARNIIYLSCNPARLARDLRVLQTSGWQTRLVQPVDFFPQTPEIEAFAVVERK